MIIIKKILTRKYPALSIGQAFKIKPYSQVNSPHNSQAILAINQLSFRNCYQISHLQQEDDIKQLQNRYKYQKSYEVFDQIVKNSQHTLDQLNIFKIFKIIQQNEFNHDVYQKFFSDINVVIKKKSDTMLLLMARLRVTIAKNYIKQKDYPIAIKNLQQSLEILQNSLVPPLFPYYTIYRHYGFVHYDIGDFQKAKQILIQSVQILMEYLNHSDDQVASNQNCKQQAKAYNILAMIDQQNNSKWIERANKQWSFFDGQRHKQLQYAKTVAQNIKKQMQRDKQKGDAYYHFNLYKFQDNEMKQILKKAKEVAQKSLSEKSI